jgi:hypothetical protein
MIFEFYELPIRIENRRLWASGQVYVEYTVNPAEPDVGYMSSWVEIDGLCDWEIHLTDEDGEDVFLSEEIVIPHLTIAVHKCDLEEFIYESL